MTMSDETRLSILDFVAAKLSHGKIRQKKFVLTKEELTDIYKALASYENLLGFHRKYIDALIDGEIEPQTFVHYIVDSCEVGNIGCDTVVGIYDDLEEANRAYSRYICSDYFKAVEEASDWHKVEVRSDQLNDDIWLDWEDPR